MDLVRGGRSRVPQSLLGVPGSVVDGASAPLVGGKVSQRRPRIPPVIEARVVVPTRRFGSEGVKRLAAFETVEHGEVLETVTLNLQSDAGNRFGKAEAFAGVHEGSLAPVEMEPGVLSWADCQPMDIAIHAPQPGPQWEFRDCGRTIQHTGRTAVVPNHITSVAHRLGCIPVETQDTSASAPQPH